MWHDKSECEIPQLNNNTIMRKRLLTLLQCAALLCPATAKDYTQYVNPNLGVTHSRWFFYTPAAMPFGMAKLGPSTNGTYGNANGWEAVGYQDDHRTIDGFPCLHEFQVGGIALMPVTGEVKTVPGKVEDASTGFRGAFDKASELSTAGYYRVHLTDYDVTTELTATLRTGFQRYTFPQSDDAHILFNIGNRQDSPDQRPRDRGLRHNEARICEEISARRCRADVFPRMGEQGAEGHKGVHTGSVAERRQGDKGGGSHHGTRLLYT